jgi:hypothetical protein
LACGYFYYVSKWWQFLQIPTIVLAIIGFLSLAFMPETPRFYLSQRRFDDARKVFKFIALKNSRDPSVFNNCIFPHEDG